MQQRAHDQGTSNATFGWRIWYNLAKLHVCEVRKAFEYLEVIRSIVSLVANVLDIVQLFCYNKLFGSTKNVRYIEIYLCTYYSLVFRTLKVRVWTSSYCSVSALLYMCSHTNAQEENFLTDVSAKAQEEFFLTMWTLIARCTYGSLQAGTRRWSHERCVSLVKTVFSEVHVQLPH